MKNIATITRQGQLTIPRHIRKHFGIRGSTKAMVTMDRDIIMVEPQKDFWSLSGSLKSNVKLSQAQLKRARQAFAKDWARAL